MKRKQAKILIGCALVCILTSTIIGCTGLKTALGVPASATNLETAKQLTDQVNAIQAALPNPLTPLITIGLSALGTILAGAAHLRLNGTPTSLSGTTSTPSNKTG